MANLLDQASIVLTPTAYKNSRVMCVKPSDASGDFTFSRNSAATRVNAQGLVENVQRLSSNLVQNGDFSEEGVQEVSNGSFSQEGSELIIGGDFSNPSDWSLSGQNLSISNGKGISTGSNFGAQFKQTILTINKTYKLVFDIVDYTSGAIGLTANYYGVQQTFNSVGTHTAYFTSLNQTELRLYSENFIGSIDNCSVREVGQDWTLGDGWSIGEDKAVCDGSQTSVSFLFQNGIVQSGKIYKVTYDVVSFTSGEIIAFIGGSQGQARTSVGTYTEYLSTSNTNFWLRASSDFNGSITNISVKEVGQNWTLTSGAFITDIGARLTHTPTAGSISSVGYTPLVVGNNYKMTYEITESISGGIKINSAVNPTMVSSVGIHTKYFEADSSFISIARTDPSDNDVTITNISVIEITDDTNLPRINYEGFSYQDALGSELVTNGDFATDSDWSKNSNWSISGGTANSNATSGNLQQLNILEIGKTYILQFELLNFISGGLYLTSSAYENQIAFNTDGNYSVTIVPKTTNLQLYSVSFNGSIDNVSVKEYLGQEVVPNSGCGSWLWEPQSTNLILSSQSYTSNWIIGDTTIIENIAISPDGSQNGGLFKGSTTSQRHYIQAALVGANVSASLSFFAKAKELRYIQIACQNTGLQYANFDIQDGVVGNVGGDFSNAKIEDYGNGWYRCSVVSTNRYTNVWVSLISGLNSNWLENWSMPNNTDGLYIYGFQTEQQSYATSYIPTEGSTVTRNQDVCTNGGSLASINSTEGTLYGEFSTIANDNNSNWINISDGTPNNWLFVGRDNDKVRVYLRANNAVVLSNMITPLSNNNKVALSYKSGDIRAYINGVEIVNLTSTFSFTSALNTLNFNEYNGGGTTTQIAWKAVAVWKEALSDAELTELTTI